MGIGSTSNSTTVTISGGISTNLPTPGISQTVISSNVEISGNATTTIRTVTAGKTFYLTGIIIGSGAVGNGGGLLEFQNDGTKLFKNLYQCQNPGTIQVPINAYYFKSPISVLATKVLQVVSTSTTGTISITANGFEQ